MCPSGSNRAGAPRFRVPCRVFSPDLNAIKYLANHDSAVLGFAGSDARRLSPPFPTLGLVVTDLISILENAVAHLSKYAQGRHRFRFVSSAQVVPYTVALAQWAKNGRQGPQPPTTIAEMRAAIYAQAKPASDLKAFSKVASVAGVELAGAALAGLKAGQVVVTYTALRGFIERTAHATATAAALRNIKTAPIDGPLTPVLELSEVIYKALYATQREWTKLVKADFRKASVKEMKYVKKENIANMLSDNILNSIDKLDKKIPGTRLAYEILCEYLHPNVGDLLGTTLEGELFVDRYGTRHVFRTIGLGQKTFKGLPDMQILNTKLFDICGDIIPQMPLAIEEIDSISQVATRLTRRFAHGVVKKHYRKQFSDSDLCPCLSGLTVTACAGLRSR